MHGYVHSKYMPRARSSMQNQKDFINCSPVCITNLHFADDIALICEQMNEVQALLDRVESVAAPFGMIVK